MSDRDGRYRVYILEVASHVARQIPALAELASEGTKVFYVGETGKPVAHRIAEHRTGLPVGDGAKRLKKCELTDAVRSALGREATAEELPHRKKLSKQYEEVGTRQEVAEIERTAIDDLRAKGHVVYPRGGGSGVGKRPPRLRAGRG